MPRRFFLILALLSALTAPAHADSWPKPMIEEVFSASREYFVRITPGDSLGDLVGFAGNKKGKYATAEVYRRAKDRSYQLIAETSLPHPVAPLELFVSNDGKFATIDNWHNLGQGKAVVLYESSGKILRAYELKDLFDKETFATLPRSASSIHWRQGPAYIRPDQKTLLVTVKSGADFLFGLESGEYHFCENVGMSARCRHSSEPGVWRQNIKLLTR